MESEELDFKDILRHLDRESAHFIIRLEKHHSGRLQTIIQPHDLIKDSIDLPGLAHKLRETLGTGGEVENDRIILHGDQRDKVRDELSKLGVSKDRVEII